MPAFFWNSLKALYVSIPKVVVAPCALSFWAAGPIACAIRTLCRFFTSSPTIQSDRLRVNEPGEDTGRASSAWASSDASCAFKELISMRRSEELDVVETDDEGIVELMAGLVIQ